MFDLRRNFPMPIMRPSFSVAWRRSASEFTIIVLNFMQVNERPNRPTLFCKKNTGPGEEIFISIASTGVSQLKITRITRADTLVSKALLQAKYSLLPWIYCRRLISVLTGAISGIGLAINWVSVIMCLGKI